MIKQIAIYVTIFVVIFTLFSVGLFFLFQKRSAEREANEAAIADSLQVSASDAAAAKVDSVMASRRDSLAHMQPDTLAAAVSDLPDPLVEYNNLMTLRSHLIEFYSNGEIRAYSNAEIDSIFTGFVAQIDSLAYKQQQYIARINQLSRSSQRSQTQVTSLEEQITHLEEKISTMETDHAEEIAMLTTGDRKKLLADAANMWSSMKPANAAQSLLPLADNEVIAILRNMNTRRASKILDEMPEMRAASLLKSMSNP